MNNKLWLVIAGIFSVGVLAMGWFIGVSPKLDEMNTANEQRASAEQQNTVYEAKLKELEKQFQKIDELKVKLTDSQLGLPPGDQLSTFLGQLHQLEASSGASLTKFAAGDAVKYAAVPGSIRNAAVTADNFVAITIDLTFTGTRDQVINFLSDLQSGKRLFLVTKLGITEQAAGTAQGGGSGTVQGGYVGTVTGLVYVLVDPSAPPPAPTPVGSLDTTPTPSPSPKG